MPIEDANVEIRISVGTGLDEFLSLNLEVIKELRMKLVILVKNVQIVLEILAVKFTAMI